MLDALLIALLSGGVVYAALYFSYRRIQAELAKAKADEQRFRGLTELSADWFWQTDAEHRIVWLSGGTAVATFFGSAPVYGRRIWEIAQVEIEPSALEAHRRGLAQQPAFFDLEIVRTDERGARQIHIMSGQSLIGPDAQFLGYRGVGRDVTEQRYAERKLLDAKDRLELALDGGNLAEWHIDLQASEMFAGDGWARFLGYERSPQPGSLEQLLEFVHADDREAFREAFIGTLKGVEPYFDCDFRMRHVSGAWLWLHARGRVTERDEKSGRALAMSGTLADIDSRKRAEQALRATELRFDDVAGLSREYVWETDAEWRYTYLSERVEAVLGYTRAELLGRTPSEFMPLGEEIAVREWLEQNKAAGGAFRDLVHRSLAKSGAVVWQQVSGVPVRDAAGTIAGYRGTAADITGRKAAEARIEYLVTRDALTGLPNRVLLADRAGQAILAAARSRSQLALLCLDLDRFKLVNASLDHRGGDALLRAVAERLEGLLREETLARLGDDAFVILQPVRSVEDAAALAQRVLDVLARPFAVDGRSLGVAASLGVSLYPADGRDFPELLRNADAAMHTAKESGRGTFRFFSPALQARSMGRLRLENELRAALARGELALHWQPVLQQKNRVIGAEALIRWNHPERGLLPPEDFVPLAEECGLIRQVGEWTLERALSQAGAWQRKLPAKPWIAVNVSAQELALGNAYFEKLRDVLKANSLDGTRVSLEITERTLVSNLAENLDTLRRIAALGVCLAIDDFGTGYSSLAYLRLLPVHKLKIDRSFLREIDSQRTDAAIVEAVIGLARTLGLAVAAEGIERDPQLLRLLALGCDEWQGHLFSPPVDAASFERLLSSPNSSGAAA